MAAAQQLHPRVPAGFAPLRRDHERFQTEVEEYADRMREWLTGIDAFLDDRVGILEAAIGPQGQGSG